MILKLTAKNRSHLVECKSIQTYEHLNYSIEINAMKHCGEVSRFIVKDEHSEDTFDRAYVMESGQTVDVIRQLHSEPAGPKAE